RGRARTLNPAAISAPQPAQNRTGARSDTGRFGRTYFRNSGNFRYASVLSCLGNAIRIFNRCSAPKKRHRENRRRLALTLKHIGRRFIAQLLLPNYPLGCDSFTLLTKWWCDLGLCNATCRLFKAFFSRGR